LLKRNNVVSIKQRKKIIQCTRIQMLTDFIFNMLEPIIP
jgi:hypothetical protein